MNTSWRALLAGLCGLAAAWWPGSPSSCWTTCAVALSTTRAAEEAGRVLLRDTLGPSWRFQETRSSKQSTDGAQGGAGLPMDMLRELRRLKQQLQSPEWLARTAAWRRRAERREARRGIVIAAGGAVMLNSTWALLEVLRCTLGCTLPVEIVHNGPREMTPTQRRTLEEGFAGVSVTDASAQWAGLFHRARRQAAPVASVGAGEGRGGREDARRDEGYVFKALALCHATSFDEVILLDADNLPLRDPQTLFETEEYRRSGNLFFPDWARHADVLEWVWFLNSHYQTVYQFMHGDKDTYRLAFHLAEKAASFEQVTFAPRVCLHGEEVQGRPGNYLHVGMVHHSPQGHLAFFHRTVEGKYNPAASRTRRCSAVSLPLSPLRAGAFLDLGMRYRHYQVDLTDHRECFGPSLRASRSRECGWESDTLHSPVPLLPVAAVAQLQKVLNASDEVHSKLQQAAQQDCGAVVASSCGAVQNIARLDGGSDQ